MKTAGPGGADKSTSENGANRDATVEESCPVDRDRKGLVSTFHVALPEGSVALTIRHRSVTVEVSVRVAAGRWHTDPEDRSLNQCFDSLVHAQPPTSELFRLMGAAVWPAALGTVEVSICAAVGGAFTLSSTRNPSPFYTHSLLSHRPLTTGAGAMLVQISKGLERLVLCRATD